MRTSAKWTLAISIVLLVAGILLVGYGLYVNMDKYVVKNITSNGVSFMKYQTKVSGNISVALCYLAYGYLVFISGLASMGYFIYLATHPVAKKEEAKKENAIENTTPQVVIEEKKTEVEYDNAREERVLEEYVPEPETSGEGDIEAEESGREEN